MKKIVLLTALLLAVIILPAQGIYELWGMTGGGTNGLGIMFNTDAAGNNFRSRHEFSVNSQGASPAYTQPAEYNGKLYGMTAWGGAFDKGVIFEWDPATNVYTKKLDLTDSTGSHPSGSLVLNNGKFYGMTSQGGSRNRHGVIFEWDPATNIYTKKIIFSSDNGSGPTGSLTLSDGKFYGMTPGGGSNGNGIIFEWDPATNVITKKFDFNNNDGINPNGDLAVNNGKFYGMTHLGGPAGAGVIFEWDPATNVYTKKIDLAEGQNGRPFGSLTLNNGKFYGMSGEIFEWDPVTNIYTKKIDLGGVNGYSPTGNLTLKDGKFYGMTQGRGANNQGLIFEWDPAANLFITKFDFDGPNGSTPRGTLTLSGGKFYGMTPVGGNNVAGVFFDWDPATNVYEKKVDFNSNNGDGTKPAGTLTQSGGKLYGMTFSGGRNDEGVIFNFDPATNTYTKKIDLIDSTGTEPFGSLTMSGSRFYGMTSNGGSHRDGVIFEWDPAANIYTKKIDFDGTNGAFALGNLVLNNNKLYGMTSLGGTSNKGVIFEWSPATNLYAVKVNFTGDNGATPYGSLTLYNGKFYGKTSAGGINNVGVIFQWDPVTNVFTKMKDVLSGDLQNLFASNNLTVRNDKFYGMTYGRGEQDRTGGYGYGGELFEWDPSTNIVTSKIDLNVVFGSQSQGDLTLSGSKFYGMSGVGSLFEWDPDTNIYTQKNADSIGPDVGNDLALVAAPVANGLQGSCVSFPSVTIDSSNNNKWVAITDSQGDAVAEIKANGNNLGTVSVSMYINNAAVREDENKRLYLDRNVTITPAVQPGSSVDVRLYIKGSEFLSLKNAVNSNGDSSGIGNQ